MKQNKLSFIALSIAGVLYSFQVIASENIVVDNNKKRDLTVEIKNGIEHINIEKANENGISHNYYQKFNVSEKGAIINNPTYLANSAAKFIISEVTSNEKSLLKGKLRVKGDDAYLMIANPNGIECNGCSFSGTKQQLLVTGKVKLINNEESSTLPQGSKIHYKDGDLKINVSAEGKIIFKNNIKPVHDEGLLTLISNEIAMSDGNLNGKFLKTIIGNNEIKFSRKHKAPGLSYVRYNFSTHQQLPANYSLIRKGKDGKADLYRVANYSDYYHSATGHFGKQENSPDAGLLINQHATVKFSGLSITQTGDSSVINEGQLSAKKFYADIENEFINRKGAVLDVGDQQYNKSVNKSLIKAKVLKFDHATFEMNNTGTNINVDSFENTNSHISSKNAIVYVKSNQLDNKKDFYQYHHFDGNKPSDSNYGQFSLNNSKLVFDSKKITNNADLIGDGRLEINTDSLKNRGTIKVEGKRTTNIGQHIINKNGTVKIKVNGKLDTYGSNIVASNGLIIDAQQLKAKDGNIKIINKKIKPVISTAALIDITTDEQLKFVNSNKFHLKWKI